MMKCAQVTKTKDEVGAWLDRWAADNLAEADSEDKEIFAVCVKWLKKLNGELLLEHVTEVCKSKEEFSTAWTNSPTHVLSWSLYTAIRKFLGAGKE